MKRIYDPPTDFGIRAALRTATIKDRHRVIVVTRLLRSRRRADDKPERNAVNHSSHRVVVSRGDWNLQDWKMTDWKITE